MKLGQYIKELLELHQQVGPDVELHYASDDEGNAYPVLQYSPSIRLIKKSTDESLTLPEYLKQFAYVHSISNFRRSPSSNVIYYNTDDLYTFVVRGVLRSELDTLAA